MNRFLTRARPGFIAALVWLLASQGSASDYRKWRGLARRNWAFLTGSADHTRVLASYLGIGYWFYDNHVLHDFGITLLDSEGISVRKLQWADTRLDGFLPARTAPR